MRIKEVPVFKFDELEENVQEKVIEKFREHNLDYEWYDHLFEDIATIAELFGLDIRTRTVKLMNGKTRLDPCIYFSGFWNQGDGACFEGDYEYKKGGLKEVKKYAPADTELHEIVRGLQELQRKYFYKVTARTYHRGHYYHELCMVIDAWYTTVDNEYTFNMEGDDYEELCDLLRSFAQWIYSMLQKEYEWLNSDEEIIDLITENEYEFEKNGEIA